MTARYTNQEWTSIIAETERRVLALLEKEEKAPVPAPCPAIGSGEFSRTIDHTLLKIEATRAQIDALCSEARVAGFAVGVFLSFTRVVR